MSKYGSTKCVARDGTKFPSKRECARYEDLLLLVKLGEVSDLRIQVSYELIPKQRGGKRHERAVSYVADFVYRDKADVLHVEDAKGFRTKDYVIKRKLLLWVHGIAIEEV